MHSDNHSSGWGTQDIELHLLFSIRRIHISCVSLESKNMAPSQFLGFFAILCRKWWHRPQSLISCPLRAVCLFSWKVVRRRNRSLNSVVHSWNGIIHSGPGIIASSFYRAAIGVEDKITGKERWRLTDRRGRLQYRRWTPTYKSDVTLPIIDHACSCDSFMQYKYFEFARTFVQLR